MLEFTNESLDRIKKLEEIRARGIDPYPAEFHKTHSLIEAKEMEDGHSVKVAGRIILKRDMGKITFMHLLDFSGKLQVILQQHDFPKEDYKFWVKNLDMADYIGLEGETFTTHKGEKSIIIKKLTLLTKSLLPLPEKFHGIQDEETKFRKRYLDILMNEDTKGMIIRRGKFFNAMREFLLSKGFIEVDTPIIELTTGGADANPFATHHNAFDIDVFLRISAGELWQKRLMVAGLEKTFEIGRIFRNEGVSPEHAQDYSQMEVYWSYADYSQMRQLMKEMYLHIVDTVYGTRKFHIRGYDIDFDNDWKEIDYKTVILDMTGIDITKATEAEMITKLESLGAKYEAGNMGRLIDYLWKYCRKQIPGPAFLVNEPKIVSPLSKSIPGNEEFTQRFHILIAGSEVGNGYSELNDPLDQKDRFEQQQALRDAGDDEAQMADWDFVEALMHGMPPTAGFGVSERLFAFLENKPIRETQTFPLMKPIVGNENIKPAHSKAVSQNSINKDDSNSTYTNLPSIKDAEELIDKYANKTKNHLLAVGYVMRYFAEKLGQNADAWQLVGMLHDIDRDYIDKDANRHCKEDLEKISSEINLPKGLVEDIKSHGHWLTGVKPDTLIRKYICATDELTGFIVAVTRMMPNKSFDEVKVSSVIKKIKDKTFAAGVSREEVLNCETMLGIGLDEFIGEVLEALKKYKTGFSM